MATNTSKQEMKEQARQIQKKAWDLRFHLTAQVALFESACRSASFINVIIRGVILSLTIGFALYASSNGMEGWVVWGFVITAILGGLANAANPEENAASLNITAREIEDLRANAQEVYDKVERVWTDEKEMATLRERLRQIDRAQRRASGAWMGNWQMFWYARRSQWEKAQSDALKDTIGVDEVESTTRGEPVS